MDRKIVKDPEL